MDYVILNNDDWEDQGRKYKLLSYERKPNSTATKLVLEYNGNTIEKTVPYHTIEWMED